jgi:hypothetical protein
MGSGEIEVGEQEEEAGPVTQPEPNDTAETTATQQTPTAANAN